MRKLSLLFLLVFWVMLASAERQPYERYQTIVERQMFGPLPANFDPTKKPSQVAKGAGGAAGGELTKEQEQLKSSVRFSAIDILPDGSTAVGFADNSNAKSPQYYYLRVGESRDGWEVREADPVAKTMTIFKDEIEVTLEIGGDSGKGAGTTSRAGMESTKRNSDSPPGASLRSRRAEKMKNLQLQLEESKKKNAERVTQLEAERRAREADNASLRDELKAIRDSIRRDREDHERQNNEQSNHGGEAPAEAAPENNE